MTRGATTPSRTPTPKRTLAVGIAGTGFMGRVHARSARVNGVRLVGVSSSNLNDAERAADRGGFERAYADSRALVTDPEIDIVHICTPNHMHAELAGLALAAGKHVICEKPLTPLPDEADTLAALARSSGLIAAVPFVYRYYPMVQEARWRVAHGELGEVVAAHGHYLQSWLRGANETNWRVDPALGGPSRAFADIGCHWSDLLEFVTGDEIVAVSGQTRIVEPVRPVPARSRATFDPQQPDPATAGLNVQTEDIAIVSFRTRRSTIGSVTISQVAAGHDNDLRLELLGSSGGLTFSHTQPEQLWLASGDGSPQVVARDPQRLLSRDAAELSRLPAGHPQGYQDCFDAFVADAYRAVREGAPVARMPTFDDGARMARLSQCVLESAAHGGAWTALTAPRKQEPIEGVS